MKPRTIYHSVVSIALWVLFVYYWRVVFNRELGYSTTTALLVLGGVLVAAYLSTAYWILHNLRLARRFSDRRTSRRPVERDFSTDFLGRWVRINTVTGEPKKKDFKALRRASYIEIDVDSGEKHYTSYSKRPRARERKAD